LIDAFREELNFYDLSAEALVKADTSFCFLWHLLLRRNHFIGWSLFF